MNTAREASHSSGCCSEGSQVDMAQFKVELLVGSQETATHDPHHLPSLVVDFMFARPVCRICLSNLSCCKVNLLFENALVQMNQESWFSGISALVMTSTYDWKTIIFQCFSTDDEVSWAIITTHHCKPSLHTITHHNHHHSLSLFTIISNFNWKSSLKTIVSET